jgi:hypothetical protein
MVSADITPFFDLASELALVHGHGNTIADVHARRVTDHLRAIAIPAHRVPARQHGERTQAFEPCDRLAEARIERVAFPIAHGRESCLAGDEPRSQAGEPPAQIECFEREPQRLIAALPR